MFINILLQEMMPSKFLSPKLYESKVFTTRHFIFVVSGRHRHEQYRNSFWQDSRNNNGGRKGRWRPATTNNSSSQIYCTVTGQLAVKKSTLHVCIWPVINRVIPTTKKNRWPSDGASRHDLTTSPSAFYSTSSLNHTFFHPVRGSKHHERRGTVIVKCEV